MRLLRRLTDERGVALPVAVAVVFAVAGLATVAARSAIVSNNQSFRDNNAKRAVQAANAGLQAAVYQTNLMQPATDQCVYKATSNNALTNGAVSNGWCPAQAEDLGDGASYTMVVSAAGAETMSSTGVPIVQRTVVATGTVNGVIRRAVTTINAATGRPIFPPQYAVVVKDSIDIKNNADIDGHIGSNGSITVKNNMDICGNITPGPGKTASIGKNLDQCAGHNTTPAAEPFDLQPVDTTQAVPNDNGRLSSLNSPGKDTCSGCGNVSWSTTTRMLSVGSGGVLTLSGNKYFLCGLQVSSGGKIQITARTTPLYIYIDSPSNCSSGTGVGSITFDGQLNNLYSPAEAVAFLVAGSATQATSVDLPSNGKTEPVAIYAPNSTVIQKNNVTFNGAIVAKSLDVKNNANFAWDPTAADVRSGSSIRVYQAASGSYKECTNAPTGAALDSGC